MRVDLVKVLSLFCYMIFEVDFESKFVCNEVRRQGAGARLLVELHSVISIDLSVVL